jgi:ankyrin repeat protein
MEPENYEKIKELVARGVDINQTTRQGYSLLGAMVINGNPDMVKYLINEGADVNLIVASSMGASLTALEIAEIELMTERGNSGSLYNQEKIVNLRGIVTLLTENGAKRAAEVGDID